MCIDSKRNVRDKGAPRDGGEPGTHNLMTFRPREVRDKGLNQDGSFALSENGRCEGTNGLRARDLHHPKEHGREFSDKPLQYAPTIHYLDAWHEYEEEPALTSAGTRWRTTDGRDPWGRQERSPSIGKSDEFPSIRYELGGNHYLARRLTWLTISCPAPVRSMSRAMRY
jgi:hypothetical protein